MRQQQSIHAAYEEFKLADTVWHNWLEYTFGKSRAGDMRYRPEGKTHPNCVAAYQRFTIARDHWFSLVQQNRLFR